MAIRQLPPRGLRDWLDEETLKPPMLLDVREPWEVALCSIAGTLAIPMNSIPMNSIPMNSIPLEWPRLDPDAETVVICHHGGRSMQVALFLERNGFAKLHNLSGGVDAGARQIDPAMVIY